MQSNGLAEAEDEGSRPGWQAFEWCEPTSDVHIAAGDDMDSSMVMPHGHDSTGHTYILTRNTGMEVSLEGLHLVRACGEPKCLCRCAKGSDFYSDGMNAEGPGYVLWHTFLVLRLPNEVSKHSS